MRKLILSAVFLCGLVMVAGPARAADGQVFISTFGIGGMTTTFRVPVVSLKESRFQTVMQQQYDFSCGSAALASLLTYHYNEPVTEAEVFEAMYLVGDREKIHQLGFSMLDMKKFLNAVGWVADGFEIPLDALADVGVPAITLINTNGYKHFVIVKGVADGRVLIGDPSRGVHTLPVSKFRDIWNGVVFVIRDRLEMAKASFNAEEDWNLFPSSPYSTAINARQSLSSLFRNMQEFIPGVITF